MNLSTLLTFLVLAADPSPADLDWKFGPRQADQVQRPEARTAAADTVIVSAGPRPLPVGVRSPVTVVVPFVTPGRPPAGYRVYGFYRAAGGGCGTRLRLR